LKIVFYLDDLIRSVRKISNKSNHRLPINVIPSHYRLYLDVNQLEQFIFHGTVDIDVQVKY
jgi:hypothetical protein